jgi:hypothetical protein
VSYKIDAFHDKDGIVVEVEAGRAAYNNAIHYDIIWGKPDPRRRVL